MTPENPALIEFIADRINMGIIVVDREFRIQLWNRFMQTHSGFSSGDVEGKNLFDALPELPRSWLTKKVDSVFALASAAFTTWQHRPYLIRMTHNRPVTGGVEHMHQNCTFLPVFDSDGKVGHVCITIEDVTEHAVYEARLRHAMAEIEYLSTHDSLTGLVNRRTMEERLDGEIDRARRYGTPCSLVLLDIDRFKDVNDTYGHLSGDEVLRSIAMTLRDTLRTSDTASRYGGDEFVLVLPETTIDGATILAERIRERMAKNQISVRGKKLSITVSVGITQLRGGKRTRLELLNEADQALYACKLGGRNKVVVFDDSLKTTTDEPSMDSDPN
ncbi:MAG: GGDEF domain-containing protein [bacterium]|nr:GGDEF domain-containing protein [bacterium]